MVSSVTIPVTSDWLITLDASEPAATKRALEELGVAVVAPAPASALLVAGQTRPLNLELAGVDGLEAVIEAAREGQMVVVRGVLDEEAAVRLEDAGIAYIDTSGRSWLPGQPRTKRTRAVDSAATVDLRPASLRLAQLLADHPEEKWTLTRLAVWGESTRITAQRLLARLEAEGLIERFGRGGHAGRQVTDAAALRHWLARNGRSTRSHRLACFVPDASPDKLAELSEGRLILTGAAAAAAAGMPVLSTVQRPMYRVEVEPEALDEVPATLGGFRTDRGPNLVLVADPYRLAALDATTTDDGVLVAPMSRVMLDLYLEPRAAATVDVFLDLWARPR